MMSSASTGRTAAFFPEAAYGAALGSVGKQSQGSATVPSDESGLRLLFGE
jgi:hypothetical protein